MGVKITERENGSAVYEVYGTLATRLRKAAKSLGVPPDVVVLAALTAEVAKNKVLQKHRKEVRRANRQGK